MFKIGDVVQLKSGGPKMTVTDVDFAPGKPCARCQWFTHDMLKDGLFVVSTLVPFQNGSIAPKIEVQPSQD